MRRGLAVVTGVVVAMLALVSNASAAGDVGSSAAQAAARSGVPAQLLLAVAWENSRFEMTQPEAGGEGAPAYGPMGLLTGGTLEQAAKLAGLPAAAVKTNFSANMAAGAVLLAHTSHGARGLLAFEPAIKQVYGALAADQIYRTLEQGAERMMPGGEFVQIAAHHDLEPFLPHFTALRSSGALQIHYVAASRGNYNAANRPASNPITRIVIHVTQGSYAGTVKWFQNPRAKACANYVVSSAGDITQMVPDRDIAWHSGNSYYNATSIGIEHEGYIQSPAWFTDAEYRSSARLVARLAHEYRIPVDRAHIIGHNQVPDPNNPHLYGGFAHHTDPGKYWNWTRYMAYVKAYYKGSKLPAVVVAPQSPKTPVKPNKKTGTSHDTSTKGSHAAPLKFQVVDSITNGQKLTGSVHWEATVAGGKVERVDFLVDGMIRHTEHQQPYLYSDDGSWDTQTEQNGTHTVQVRAVSTGGAVSVQTAHIAIANDPLVIQSMTVSDGQTLHGKVDWQATVAGGEADHVDFFVDDQLKHTEYQVPYSYGDGLDTIRQLSNGTHTLMVRATDHYGRVAEASATVTVANWFKVHSSVSYGATLSGAVHWEATADGGDVSRIDMYLDQARHTENQAPYVYGPADDSTIDTTKLRNGQHTMALHAVSTDGRTDDIQFPVTVSNPENLNSSIGDGQTLSGKITWTADNGGSGVALGHVEFWVDGARKTSDYSSPYSYLLDTTRLAAGAHTLKLVGFYVNGDQQTATVAVIVGSTTVSQPPTTAPTPTPTPSPSLPAGTGTPVIGSTTTGPTADSNDPGTVEAFRETATATASIGALQVLADANSSGTPLVAGVYSDNSGHPGTLLAQGSLSSPAAATWNTVQLGSQVTLTSGATYWIALFSPSGTLRFRDQDGAGVSETYAYSRSSSLPSSWTTGTRYSSGGLSAFAVALPSSGSGGTTTPTPTPTPTTTTPTPTPMPTAPSFSAANVHSSVSDGQTLSGRIRWTVQVDSGFTVDHVDFLIDGQTSYTATRSGWRGYEYGDWGRLDTRTLANGSHTFGVHVVLSDGESADLTFQVSVSN